MLELDDRDPLVSGEFGKGVVEKRAEHVLGKQAERELPVGQHAVGVELPIESLKFTFECLAGTDGVTLQFLVHRMEFTVSPASCLSCGI